MKNKPTKEYQIHLQPINKQEFEFMVKNNIIKCTHGRYIGLITGGSHHTKSRWVEEPLYEKMLKLKVEKS